MKKYEIRVNLIGSFLYEVEAKSKEAAKEKAIEFAQAEYAENGLDYPVFEVDALPE